MTDRILRTRRQRALFAGPLHLVAGHDGSSRNRVLASAWHLEITIRGWYLGVGRL